MWLGGLYRRVRASLRSESIHEEIDEEMQFHIDMRAEENVRRGMAPEEARREAERRFGRLTRVKEQGYEVRGGRWLESFWRDCRYGARSLRNSPGFTLAAYHETPFNLTGRERPERVNGAVVTPEFFAVLGVQPRVGRVVLPGQDEP